MAFAALGDSRRAWELTSDQPGESCQDGGSNLDTKVEPYVSAADVYAVAPHTGAAMDLVHRFGGLDVPADRRTLLGLTLEGDRLQVDPPCPRSGPDSSWYRYRDTEYRITVHSMQKMNSRQALPSTNCTSENSIRLVNDQKPRSRSASQR